jgi:hypothetical protein
VDARRGGWSVSRGWLGDGWSKHERFAYVMSCLAAELEHNDSQPQTTTTTLLFAVSFRADDTQPVPAGVTAVSLKNYKSHEAGKSGVSAICIATVALLHTTLFYYIDTSCTAITPSPRLQSA